MSILFVIAAAAAVIFFIAFLVASSKAAKQANMLKSQEEELSRLRLEDRRLREMATNLKCSLSTLEKESHERSHAFMVLLELARTLGANIEQEKLPQLLIRIAQQLFDAEELAFFRYNESRQDLVVLASIGLPPEVANNLIVKLGEGYVGHTAAKRVTMTKEDFQLESNLIKQKLEQTREKGISPVFCIPFIQHDILLGVVEVGRMQRRSKEERDLLLVYQSLGSMALDNARLFDQLTTKDRLTGLFNRRFFDERAVVEVNRARRFGHRVSFALLDLDNYLSFIESNGAVAADRLLVRVGSLLAEHVRKIDITCRLDEDKFGVILLETEKPQAIQFAEKIRKVINEDPAIRDQMLSHQQITVSIAVMTFPDDGITIPPLMDRAFKLLAEGQAKGGNIIISEYPEEAT